MQPAVPTSWIDGFDPIPPANYSRLVPPGNNGLPPLPPVALCPQLSDCAITGCIVSPDVFLPFAEEAIDALVVAAASLLADPMQRTPEQPCPSAVGSLGSVSQAQAASHAVLCPADIATRVRDGRLGQRAAPDGVTVGQFTPSGERGDVPLHIVNINNRK